MSGNDKNPGNAARRKFLTEVLRTAGGIGLMAAGVGLFARQSSALPATAIRPPGAQAEGDFLGACIRCGLCVRDCPYDTLRLARPGEAVPPGTPYFVAREVACEMCEDIPCVAACPSGALQQSLKNIDDARMGLAVVIDQENCIAFRGLRCEVCFNICPVRGKAITLEYQHNKRSGKHARFIPVVHSDSCTGCGKCEKACILEEAAIKVLPVHLAKGELGHHYRLGWKEKQRAGKALVSPDLPHQYNLPKDLDYDLQGEGLMRREGDHEVPYSGNPLDTLNRRGKL